MIPQRSTILSLLLVAFCVLGLTEARPQSTDDYDYGDEEEGEEVITFNPTFKTAPLTTYHVKTGTSVKLICEVDRLGGQQLLWNFNSQPIRIGTGWSADNSRHIWRLLDNDKGDSLLITPAQEADTGEYSCSVASGQAQTNKVVFKVFVSDNPPTTQSSTGEKGEVSVRDAADAPRADGSDGGGSSAVSASVLAVLVSAALASLM